MEIRMGIKDAILSFVFTMDIQYLNRSNKKKKKMPIHYKRGHQKLAKRQNKTNQNITKTSKQEKQTNKHTHTKTSKV